MDILKSYVFTSFVIACLYFIVKSHINRMNKQDKELYQYVRKTLFKDSVLIFIISYLTFIAKEQFMVALQVKTQVFTNEPTF